MASWGYGLPHGKTSPGVIRNIDLWTGFKGHESRGLIHSDDAEEGEGNTERKDGDIERERKDRGRLLPVEAMRGTAVGSFLFGSVSAHVPHIFVQLFG